jgi:hypothetical protein
MPLVNAIGRIIGSSIAFLIGSFFAALAIIYICIAAALSVAAALCTWVLTIHYGRQFFGEAGGNMGFLLAFLTGPLGGLFVAQVFMAVGREILGLGSSVSNTDEDEDDEDTSSIASEAAMWGTGILAGAAVVAATAPLRASDSDRYERPSYDSSRTLDRELERERFRRDIGTSGRNSMPTYIDRKNDQMRRGEWWSKN